VGKDHIVKGPPKVNWKKEETTQKRWKAVLREGYAEKLQKKKNRGHYILEEKTRREFRKGGRGCTPVKDVLVRKLRTQSTSIDRAEANPN